MNKTPPFLLQKEKTRTQLTPSLPKKGWKFSVYSKTTNKDDFINNHITNQSKFFFVLMFVHNLFILITSSFLWLLLNLCKNINIAYFEKAFSLILLPFTCFKFLKSFFIARKLAIWQSLYLYANKNGNLNSVCTFLNIQNRA